MPLRCDMRFEKGEKKKDRPKAGRPRQKDMIRDLPSAPLELMPQFTLLCFFWFCTPWLTDVSSSQQWVIYSQTNGAVSNYTYLFRFVWFVVVFSDLLFCFRICHCVFWLVIMFSELLLCFLNCYFVFYICICVCNLLFCFLNRDLFCTYRPPYLTEFEYIILSLFLT